MDRTRRCITNQYIEISYVAQVGVGVLCHRFLTARSPKIASDGPVGYVSELGEGMNQISIQGFSLRRRSIVSIETEEKALSLALTRINEASPGRT